MSGDFRKYISKEFKPDTLQLIAQASQIADSYEAQGMILTLRQLYYQFVARGLLPNSQASYNRLGSVVSDGRLAGLISWTALEDRNRSLMGLQSFDSPGHLIKSARSNYRIDKWANQPFRPEVWIEKAALEGVIGGICNELQVDFFACRGYNSQSEQWRAGQRFANYIRRGQQPIIFHLGDHDPSGIDMTRDNRDRLTLFAGTPINVQRLALNWDQIERHRPPSNPTKKTDSRATDYVAKFGNESWELDALEPTMIRSLIRDAVLRVRDDKLWQGMVEEETDDLRVLDSMIEELDN